MGVARLLPGAALRQVELLITGVRPVDSRAAGGGAEPDSGPILRVLSVASRFGSMSLRPRTVHGCFEAGQRRR
jgi:hypothetical protein